MWPFILVTFIAILISSLIDIINHIIFKKENIKTQKKFTKKIDGLLASIYRGIISLATLPSKAYISIKAIIKTLYRMTVTKRHLLEWTTSEEAEKKSENSLNRVYKLMIPNVILGIFGIIFFNSSYSYLSLFWILAPYIMYYISKPEYNKKAREKLNQSEIDYTRKIAEDTWKYFSEYMNKENNFLPPDNFQESRREKVVHRTSSTNIGLGLMTIISSYDLKFITLEKAISCIENTIYTIQKLDKWNGHLYNWYNTLNLEPLVPKYVSTVDSGNFVGYLFTLKGFLVEKQNTQYKGRILRLIEIIDKIISDTDFSYLYSRENRLLSIGFNVEENKLTDTYYDLLASEARQASLIAIAKKDIEAKHWNNLSRTLTKLDNYKGLISWSGTAFEYLMPNINIKRYKGSLLDESCKFMLLSQQKYANKLRNTLGNIRISIQFKRLKL